MYYTIFCDPISVKQLILIVFKIQALVQKTNRKIKEKKQTNMYLLDQIGLYQLQNKLEDIRKCKPEALKKPWE